MKKGFKIGLFCLGMLGLGIVAYSIPNHAVVAYAEDEATFEQKTYVYEDEQGGATLVLLSETEFSMTVGEETKNGTYVRNGNVLTLTMNGNSIDVEVNDILGTFGEPAPAPATCTVVVDAVEHAKVATSIKEGEPGDVCVVNIKGDLFYLVDSITVNGTALVESETTHDEYSFVLAEGENKLTVTMKIDEKAVGVFYDSMKAIENKDWSYLFSVKNIMAIITSLLSGGCLIAIIRYFIKDKKLAGSVEKAAKESLEKIVPAQTKEAVLKTVENVITPIFAQLQADNSEMKKAMGVFAKCMALSQENTPEARMAIVSELSGLNLGAENDLYVKIMAYIENLFKEHEKTYNEAMAALKNISETNSAIVDENKEVVEEKSTGETEAKPDGTQI